MWKLFFVHDSPHTFLLPSSTLGNSRSTWGSRSPLALNMLSLLKFQLDLPSMLLRIFPKTPQTRGDNHGTVCWGRLGLLVRPILWHSLTLWELAWSHSLHLLALPHGRCFGLSVVA